MAAEKEASERVEQLIGLTERLTALIGQECQAFEQRRPHDVALTLDETSRLANLYRHESVRVRNNVDLVQAAPLAKRMRLMRATEAFDAVLARHGRALEAAKTITEGIVRAVAEQVADTKATGVGYGSSAAAASAGAAKAMTLNKRA
ncbi:MAG: flbY [Caulobacteraceae bacterium]|nr:flbY [Caulobacteraceae bacterium]